MGVAHERYVALTTFQPSGAPVTTPSWIVPLGDNQLGILTSLQSGEAERVRTNPMVRLRPCSPTGKATPGTREVVGTASLVNGSEYERVRRAAKEKYGLRFSVATMTRRLQSVFKGKRGPDAALVIGLHPDQRR